MDATLLAFRLYENEGRSFGKLETMRVGDLDEGDLLVRVAYSSVNYKDALAATGQGKIVRRFPCVGGIDLVGQVVTSASPDFQVGDDVVVGGFGLGVSHDGGYAQYARVPSAWAVPLAPPLTPYESMALGTAGFTAALAVERLEVCGLRPGHGAVAVTGANGGVGSLAIALLAAKGYDVVAFTNKLHLRERLRNLGAAEVQALPAPAEREAKPLSRAKWAAAIDNLGGDVLPWLVSATQIGGGVASVGNAVGATFTSSVYPFILRGVSLLGIDSAHCPLPLRQRLWAQLAVLRASLHLHEITQVVSLHDLPALMPQFIAGQVQGRKVVQMPAP